MGNESGTWIMYGVDWNDPECIHTVQEAIWGYEHVTSRYSEKPEDSGTLPYRLFVPESAEDMPLVVFRHGADAFGDDNELQLSIWRGSP